MASVGRLPRQLLFDVPNANANRKADVLLMIGEAQPPQNGYALCHKILDYAQSRGVTKVFTFAAMATQLHPSDSPRVFGVSTDRQELSRLRERNVEILKEGQISGLNGVLLAAAAERNIPRDLFVGRVALLCGGRTQSEGVTRCVTRVRRSGGSGDRLHRSRRTIRSRRRRADRIVGKTAQVSARTTRRVVRRRRGFHASRIRPGRRRRRRRRGNRKETRPRHAPIASKRCSPKRAKIARRRSS